MPSRQAYLKPPNVIIDPGASYAASNRGFQGIPSLACGREGRLWVVWYGGITPGEDRNNYVVLAASTDQGRTWSHEKLAIDPDGRGPVRAFDPEIWLAPDGRLWVFWAQGFDKPTKLGRSGVWAITATEADGLDAGWSVPRRLCDGVMMCKPLVLSNGDWALPVSFWHRRNGGSAGMVVSSDRGATWSERGAADVPPPIRNHDEHAIVERRDGSLWMLVRTNLGIDQSVSTDGGRTWSTLSRSGIPHVRSRFFIRRLVSGRLLLVRHDPANGDFATAASKGTRSHLKAYLSEDDGRTWGGGFLLDERSGIAYPDGDQGEDGVLYVAYDFERTGAGEILMAAFREADVLPETAPGERDAQAARLRVVISKAG